MQVMKITKSSVGADLWGELLSDFDSFSQKRHRRGPTFFVRWIIKVDEDFFPNNPELHGFWETNEFVWSDEDYDKRDIRELRRVRQVERTVTVQEWEAVTEPKENSENPPSAL